MLKMRFKFSHDVWEWHLRDKDTKKSLTDSIGRYEVIIPDTEIDLIIPEFINEKVNYDIFVWRTR